MSRRIQSPSTIGLVTGFQHDLMILVLNKHNACEVGLCIWIVVKFSNSLILTFNKILFWGGGLCVDVDCFADVSDSLPVSTFGMKISKTVATESTPALLCH
jgi:hypothetical protein